MTTTSHAGADVRPRSAIPTSAFTHRRGLVCGDELTLRVVHPLVASGEVLGVVDETASDGQVQLLLSSSGVLATHSVWHDHGLGFGDLRELAAEARDNVRRAEEHLAEVGCHHPVTPVVVVWGPDQTAVPPEGRVRHDVVFVRGGELPALLRSRPGHGDDLNAVDVRDLTARLASRGAAERGAPVSSVTSLGA